MEETIRLLEQGGIQVPDGTEVGAFIVSGGRLKAPVAQPTPVKTASLGRLFTADDKAMPEGVWERSTKTTDAVHRSHLLRLLGSDLDLLGQGLTEALQDYIARRSQEKGQRGGKVQATTIRKELDTLRATWNRSALLQGAEFPPLKKLVFLKAEVKGRFQTWQEIEEAVSVGCLSPKEQKVLWECLFLTRSEVEEFLTFALSREAPARLHPCLVFVADTGARRSEILRSRREDFLFKRGEVMIRERKRDSRKKETHRYARSRPGLRKSCAAGSAGIPAGRTRFPGADRRS